MRSLYYETMPSPIGEILIAATRKGLFAIEYPLRTEPNKALAPYTRPPFSFQLARSEAKTARARKQLRLYFAGRLRQFDLPLDLRGTPFQLSAWRELVKVPFGQTATYGELARRTGRPKSARAIGMALNRNKIGIIVPCHRIVGAGGRLTGYASGLGIKRRLLEHERLWN